MDYLVEFMSNVAQTKNIPTENKETQYSDVKENWTSNPHHSTENKAT
jgi:hypothetical protein